MATTLPARGRRLVAEERRLAGAVGDAVVQRGQLGLARQVGLACRRGCARAARRAPARSPSPVDADAVLGRQLDGQVDREAVRVVQPEGDVAAAGPVNRPAGPQLTPTDHPLGTGQRDQRLLEVDDARVERARELALLGGDRRRGSASRRSSQVRVGAAHRVDDDARQVGQERLVCGPAAGRGEPRGAGCAACT